MINEIFHSSDECACGYQLDFSERTIRELKRMSATKRQRLIADDEKHVVVFAQGKATEIRCPKNTQREK